MAKGTAQQSVFDRLARTDTYASRRLKEKRVTINHKEGGRPLYNIDIEPQAPSTRPSLESTGSNDSGRSRLSNYTQSTASSGSSVRSTNSYRSTTSNREGSIFDRLAYTGTKSSLRKHKKSDTYDSVKDKRFQQEHLLREYKGNTRVLSKNLHSDVEETRKSSRRYRN